MQALKRLLIPFAVLVAALPAFAQNPPKAEMSAEAKSAVLGNLTRVVKTMAFVPGIDFSKWDQFLEESKDALEKAPTEDAFAEIVNVGIAKYFHASHLVLITPKAVQARKDRAAVGIGVRVEPLDEGLRIVHVFPNTPAAQAGIQAGDVVIEADGKKMTRGMTFTGPEGTIVELKVKRGENDLLLKVERKKYSTDIADTLTWINGDTAVLKVNTFMEAYNNKKIEALMTEAQKAKKLVVDLRGNGGGIVLNMLNLLGYFVNDEEPFGYFVNRNMVARYQKETSNDPTNLKAVVDYVKQGGMVAIKKPDTFFKGSVAVLVDGASGSAAEITAQALKELRGAPVFGTKSAGAVLVSTMTDVGVGWQVQFPFMDYISAKGFRIEGTGVAPDTEIPPMKFGEKDTAVAAAVEALDKKPNALSGGGGGKTR